MQKILFVASLFVLAAFAAIPTNHEILSLWSSWKVQNNKLYNLAENRARFAIFCDNYRKVLKFNAENETPKLGLNKFADLTAEEFKNQNSRCAFFESNREFVKAHTWDYNPNEARDLPASVDWRTKGVVTPVKDQGQCGSCWTFSTTGVLEGFYAIKESKLLSFSEQQIVDCDTVDQGCDGGWPYQALVYTGTGGCELESTYPYTAQDGTCTYKKSEATAVNTGYVFVTPKDVDALKTAVVSMPVSVAIEADQDVFQLYTSGVITKNCGASLDHAVLVVGYTTISGTEAWIVKNSWAATWGDAGYVYISTNPKANAGTGVCGILSQPVIPK